MSFLCCFPFLECCYCLGCARWACKCCLHNAARDSESWAHATPDEFEPVPRLCRYILAAYENDLDHPSHEPLKRLRIDHNCLVVKKTYRDTRRKSPPYLMYLDHENGDIVLAIRGLNLTNRSDYAVLLDNKLGKRKFYGGYVHNGLLKSAGYILDEEWEVLKETVANYPDYTLTFTGHSLGSGVAALMTILVVQNRKRLGNIERKRVRCYAIAPTRCVSLNLAVKYADVINSIVLQDDFLPRTATPLEDIFQSLFCLPCLLCLRCMRDTCISEERMLKDPRRLYAPGRLYHIVERKPFRCGTYPPVVRTAVPVDGRFEHIVLSCSATSDHSIDSIEREAQIALQLMHEKDGTFEVPPRQRMERQKTIEKGHVEEHRAALQRAVTLAIPHAISPFEYGTFDEKHEDEQNAKASTRKGKAKESWDELIQRAFKKDECGHMALEKT